MSDAALVSARLAIESRRLRLSRALMGAAAGALVGLIMAMLARLGLLPTAAALPVALAGPWVGAAAGWWLSRRLATPEHIAAAFERRHAGDNLVVTAEWQVRTGGHALRDAVASAALQRLRTVPVTSLTASWPSVVVALLAGAGSVIVATGTADTLVARLAHVTEAPVANGATPTITAWNVRVQAPAYLGGATTELGDVSSVDVPDGGRVVVSITAQAESVDAVRDDDAPRSTAVGDGVATVELPTTASGVWALAPRRGEMRGPGRVLTVRVIPDQPPTVRITEPGRDRRMAAPPGDVAVALEAQDDRALDSLVLRFTKVSGSGESFTFVDRDVPVQPRRTSPGQWTAAATLPLASLDLQDGDLVVYRGVATDQRPGAAPVESDAFIVDIGPLRDASTAGGGGEDIDPEDKQGISQQMVIVKTERLHARRGQLDEAARLGEAQGLAVEQRMVRAEFVFLMGGEVQDEVEEAAHAHDLVEGRLENSGQAALLGATRAMSRAEARLTDGDTAAALVAEREALSFLREAFDRRRFLLRPVSERARIDPTRRLSGTPPPLPRPSGVEVAPPPPGLEAVWTLAEALGRADASATDVTALSARVAALGDAPALTAAATALAQASDPTSRTAALAQARQAVAMEAAQRALAAPVGAPASPLSPAVAEALRRRSRR